MLRNFLRFVTGSDLILSGTDKHYHRITVSMVELDQLPTRVVEYSSSRRNMRTTIFRCEMNAILNSNIWVNQSGICV